MYHCDNLHMVRINQKMRETLNKLLMVHERMKAVSTASHISIPSGGPNWERCSYFHIGTKATYVQPRMRKQHTWASTSISMSAISDIWHRHLLFRYRRQICRNENVIPISEVFRYRHQSSFRYPILNKKNICVYRFEPTSLGTVSERCNTKLLYMSI
jgi:hypothetical protein